MIRQDQISQAALDYCRQYKDSKYTAENAALLAFSDGANWADEKRKALWQKEQFRVYNGFEQHTKLRIPYAPYSKRQTSFRNTAKAMGYVPGNKSNPAERFVIFYTSSTHRTALKEQNGEKIGFRFINATPDEPVRLAK